MALPIARQSTDADLDALDQVCERLAGFGEDINAEWIDGYLTALRVGPRAVPADEWRATMLGEAFDRVFADPAAAQQAMAPLLARWAVLGSQLDGELLDADPERAHLTPLLLQYEGDEAPPLGAVWSLGFQDALADFQGDWSLPGDIADEDRQWFSDALDRIAAPSLTAEALAAYLAVAYAGADPMPDRDQLIDEVCYAAQDLRLFWVDHAPRPATRRVEATPGRNDPCPCGSGKKYKKCHGAAA
jgi:uncharacterized protein